MPTISEHTATDLLVAALRDGMCDQRLDEIVESIQIRRRVLDAQAAAKLFVGSEVVAAEGSGRRLPKLAPGIVTGFTRSGKVKVDFDRYGNWTFPAALLTLIEA